ncbi:MAG: SGNH/GDSL hydrolase family protein [Pirellulales bacterium]
MSAQLAPDPGPAQPTPETRPRPAKRRTGRRILARVIVLMMSTCLALLLGEVALRFLWRNPYVSEGTDAYLHLRIQPTQVDFPVDRSTIDPKLKPTRFRTTERSYVAPSGQHAQPRATVAFLGGSTTECMAVDESLRFPALVSDLLNEKGLQVNTLNGGVSGNTLHDSLNNLINHVVNDRPDFVVVMNVANDVGLLAADGDYHSREAEPLSWGTWADWSKHELSRRSSLFGLVRHATAGIQIEVNDRDKLAWRNDPARADKANADQYRARVRAFVAAAQGLGIQPILMTEPLSGARNSLTPDWADMGAQDRFNSIVRQVAAETNTPLFDLAQHLADHVPDWDQPGVVFYDGMHVHDEGSRIYARFVADQLVPLIQARSADQPPKSSTDSTQPSP